LHSRKKSRIDSSSVSGDDGKDSHQSQRSASITAADQIDTADAELEASSVATSSKTAEGKRVWDKKNICLFCQKAMVNIARHFAAVHSQENDVITFMGIEKGTKPRKAIIRDLVKRGNFKHNCNVIRHGKGNIVVRKRPSRATATSEYLPCDKCLGFFSKKMLSQHAATCSNGTEDAASSSWHNRKGVRSRGAMLLPCPSYASDGLKKKVLARMTADDIFEAVKNDQLIIDFGNKQFEKLGHLAHQLRYISNQLRELGRFLLELRKLSPKKELEDFLYPGEYKNIVQAARALGGFNSETNMFQTPSLPLKIGFSLKKCVGILKGKHIIAQNEEGKTNLKDFLEIMEINWNVDVSSSALNSLSTKKWNNPCRLPVAEDVNTFNKFIKRKQAQLRIMVSDSPSKKVFDDLCKSTLANIISFNRRRVGEVERIQLATYQTCLSGSEEMQPEVFDSLSQTEKILVKSLKRIEIRGKRGRKVPVLLTEDMRCSIDILIEHRHLSGVDESNVYLFPKQGIEGHFRGANALHNLAIESGALFPKNLTSTRLRKHIATMSQIVNLKNNELDLLAGFMGHDIRVHREYYRLPENTLQLAKVSKLLFALEKGNSKDIKGRSLDEIDVNDRFSGGESSEDSDDAIDNPVQEPVKKKIKKAKASCTFTERKKGTKRPWSKEEKCVVLKFFSKSIQIKAVPGKVDCLKCIDANKVLSGRSWSDVKFCVYNAIKKLP
jgi:hypothetical protein